jgi:hypothetical protein
MLILLCATWSIRCFLPAPMHNFVQLTAAAVTPPAEHAARRPAGEADAAADDADLGQD